MARPCHPLHADLQPVGACHWCDLYRTDAGYRALWDGTPAPAVGPGTRLKQLLAEMGVTPAAGCGCDERATRMNEWGPAGCRERRAEIVDWLREEWGRLGWLEKAKAAGRALAAGFVHPLDPVGALVDEAIRRAED